MSATGERARHQARPSRRARGSRPRRRDLRRIRSCRCPPPVSRPSRRPPTPRRRIAGAGPRSS
ncbi:hypothetical protein EF917_07605 [Streptomyces sp. WAC00469]|nr:hypothetical protein EF917_07605 [Streptomyces sp. WAC00469]